MIAMKKCPTRVEVLSFDIYLYNEIPPRYVNKIENNFQFRLFSNDIYLGKRSK